MWIVNRLNSCKSETRPTMVNHGSRPQQVIWSWQPPQWGQSNISKRKRSNEKSIHSCSCSSSKGGRCIQLWQWVGMPPGNISVPNNEHEVNSLHNQDPFMYYSILVVQNQKDCIFQRDVDYFNIVAEQRIFNHDQQRAQTHELCVNHAFHWASYAWLTILSPVSWVIYLMLMVLLMINEYIWKSYQCIAPKRHSVLYEDIAL